MAGPQYTNCVDRKDFTPYHWYMVLGIASLVGGAVTFAAVVAAASAAAAAVLVGWGVLVILVEFLQYTLDWMLNEKLICLGQDASANYACGGDICAIGEVGDIEEVGEDKNPIEGVDNDYCMNLILAPVDLAWHQAFAANDEDASPPSGKNYTLAKENAQGNLITQQPGMPDGAYGGYSRTLLWFGTAGVMPEIAAALGVATFALARPYIAWTELFGHSGDADAQNDLWEKIVQNWHGADPPVKYQVPVLHCEFEGSRINDVLNALNLFSFGGSWCKKNWFFKLLCKILLALFAPAALAAALIAWARATAGSQAPALADPAAGEVHAGDMVIMRGRWVYDGGHSGYNEMHAVRLLQRVFNVPQVDLRATSAIRQQQVDQFKQFQTAWCNLFCQVPSYQPIDPGMPRLTPSGDMSDEQEKVYSLQLQPENQWTVHPVVDGCAPKCSSDGQPAIIR